MSDLHARTLHRAAEILGGDDKLREHLRVPMSLLDAWMAGAAPPPLDVFLRAVDVISGPAAAPRPRAAGPRTRNRAAEVRLAILTGKPQAPRSVSAAAFMRSVFDPVEGRRMIDAALDAALDAAGTGMGNIQLAAGEGLRIVAQRGFQAPFLDFFAVVDHRGSACGVAAKEGRQVVVPDVESDPIFAGTPALHTLLRAGLRAVQSTPLVGQSGELLGVLSTHDERPGAADGARLKVIEGIARRAAFWLEGGSVPG